jgi:SAM-dependent methyltransferase
MAIAYYAARADEKHWSSLWNSQKLSQLTAVAERDPLSAYIERHMPRDGIVLEAGCGLGQYVLFLRRRGYAVIGGDYSLPALAAHHQAYADSPLASLDLTSLPFGDSSLAGYISLGVVEHREAGPQPFLSEAARALRPRGVALVSVPWVNGLRRLFGRRLLKEQRARRDAGTPFYQYCYTSAELRGHLEKAGLRVTHLNPYSPARGLREFVRPRARAGTTTPRAPEARYQPPRGRGLLYWRPVLAMTAHMILAVAYKEVDARAHRP